MDYHASQNNATVKGIKQNSKNEHEDIQDNSLNKNSKLQKQYL